MFYNKDLMEATGLDRHDAAKATGVACTVLNDDGTYEVGFPVAGQAHHWFREGLLRQFGQQPTAMTEPGAFGTPATATAWNEFLKFRPS